VDRGVWNRFQSLAASWRTLSDTERQIVGLRLLHGLTQRGISQRIGCSQMHASRLLNRSIAATMFAGTRGDLTEEATVLAHDGIGPGARREHARETVAYTERVIEFARATGLAMS
jgi:transcriptional regulator with XRE-family HTH domain